MVPRSDTYRPSKNFRISLLRTRQICWISAALWETSSRLCRRSVYHCCARQAQPYVATQLELILDILGHLHVDTRPHDDSSHNLLANEVPDLHLKVALAVLVRVHVDGETRCKSAMHHGQAYAAFMCNRFHQMKLPRSANSIRRSSPCRLSFRIPIACPRKPRFMDEQLGVLQKPCGKYALGIDVSHLVLEALGDAND